jgi:aryl-alcohol dehydrogenase-like predicted oxidoreductase
MQTRFIGSLEVTVAGIGCNNFGRRIDAAATATVLDAAIDAQINFFDTANMYGEGLSEEYMGRALAGRRERVIIATKVGLPMEGEVGGGDPAYVRAAAERSLRRLRTDYIDLYQLHEPDPKVPIADTLGAFQALVQEGKVREIGCSNFSAEQLDEAHAAAGTGPRFVSVQNHYSLLHREPEASVLPTAALLGIGFLPYYPLASGLLTGKLRPGSEPPADSRLREQRYIDRFVNDTNAFIVESLRSLAESSGRSMIELAFGWLLSKHMIPCVIAGARTPEQATANARAAQVVLSDSELEAINAILSEAEAR